MKALFYFHENSRITPWKEQEDKVVLDLPNNFIALADGATRNIVKEKHTYPLEFYAAQTAQTFVDTARDLQDNFDYSNGGMDELLHEVNKKIYEQNESLGFDYSKPEQYWKPECVGAVVKVVEGVLYYGVLEDVYLNVLRGDNLEDQVKMKHQIMKAYNYAKKEQEKDPTLDFEQLWCTKLRNNPEAKDELGELVGWGAFNGEQEASQFWQTGEVQLRPGDIILLVTNGALSLFEESQFNKQAEELILKTATSVGTVSQQELSQLIDQMIAAGIEKLKPEKTIVRTLWNLPPIG